MSGLDVTNLAPGTVLLGKYRVVSMLGVGGMGAVVLAEHMTLGSRVAMKFLLPQFVCVRDAAQRFLREARATTRLQSEHVAKVLDVGSLPEGIPYMVMEYLEGQDVARLLKAGRKFAIPDAVDVVVQAGEALAQAHRVGIIHRDVKPANLFLAHRPDGTTLVKVLDFGISKVAEEAQLDMNLTKTTAVLGSGLYMSPEQMRSAKNVDQRTDVYALGVCLYELLTRTQPFTADNFSELCLKVNLDPPEPLRRHRPDVPEELAAVVAKAYARAPDERWPSVAAFVASLTPFASSDTRQVIDAIQRMGAPLTTTLSPRASIPPPSAILAVHPPPAVGATARAVTLTPASALPARRKASRGVRAALLSFAAAMSVAAAAGTYFVLRRVAPGTTGGASAEPPPTAAPEPTGQLTAAATTSAPVVEVVPSSVATAEPAPSATEVPVAPAVTTTPTAVPTTAASTGKRKPPRPKQSAQPSATAAPQGPCFGLDPATGLRVIVPCK